MSFFNKIIDKAKHGAHLHHHHHHQSDTSLPAANKDNTTDTSRGGEDTKLGIHTPHSSTSSAEQHNQQQQQQNKAATPMNATMTPSNNNTPAAGYVTPRASVDKPSTQTSNANQMDVDSTNAGTYLDHFI